MRADADVQALIDMLYGALYYRLLLYTRPLEPRAGRRLARHRVPRAAVAARRAFRAAPPPNSLAP